jgi:hypothetical protein
MVKAEYDSEGDTIQIELESVEQVGYGEDVENGAVVVNVYEGRPVMIDVIGTKKHDFETPLRTAAECYGLDAEALIGIARAALAMPNRPVQLNAGARIAA